MAALITRKSQLEAPLMTVRYHANLGHDEVQFVRFVSLWLQALDCRTDAEVTAISPSHPY
jgi:hypothetical protein